MAVIGSTSPITKAQIALLGEQPEVRLCQPREDIRDAIRSNRAVIVPIQLGAEETPWLDDMLAAIQEHSPAALILSGGDTAQWVCARAGAAVIMLAGEIVTGFPYGQITGGLLEGMPIATKAGGFGQPDAFIRAVELFAPAPIAS